MYLRRTLLSQKASVGMDDHFDADEVTLATKVHMVSY
jgi:hypothetical protein